MWIRSQNKDTLRDYQGIRIDSNIMWGNTNNDEYVLGVYESENRLKEVMDELQNYIAFNEHYSHSGVNTPICRSYNYAVYQMPKK